MKMSEDNICVKSSSNRFITNCRLCLNESNTPILSVFDDKYYDLPRKIMLLTNIGMVPSDQCDAPTTICVKCKNKVESFLTWKDTAYQVQTHFKVKREESKIQRVVVPSFIRSEKLNGHRSSNDSCIVDDFDGDEEESSPPLRLSSTSHPHSSRSPSPQHQQQRRRPPPSHPYQRQHHRSPSHVHQHEEYSSRDGHHHNMMDEDGHSSNSNDAAHRLLLEPVVKIEEESMDVDAGGPTTMVTTTVVGAHHYGDGGEGLLEMGVEEVEVPPPTPPSQLIIDESDENRLKEEEEDESLEENGGCRTTGGGGAAGSRMQHFLIGGSSNSILRSLISSDPSMVRPLQQHNGPAEAAAVLTNRTNLPISPALPPFRLSPEDDKVLVETNENGQKTYRRKQKCPTRTAGDQTKLYDNHGPQQHFLHQSAGSPPPGVEEEMCGAEQPITVQQQQQQHARSSKSKQSHDSCALRSLPDEVLSQKLPVPSSNNTHHHHQHVSHQHRSNQHQKSHPHQNHSSSQPNTHHRIHSSNSNQDQHHHQNHRAQRPSPCASPSEQLSKMSSPSSHHPLRNGRSNSGSPASGASSNASGSSSTVGSPKKQLRQKYPFNYLLEAIDFTSRNCPNDEFLSTVGANVVIGDASEQNSPAKSGAGDDEEEEYVDDQRSEDDGTPCSTPPLPPSHHQYLPPVSSPSSQMSGDSHARPNSSNHHQQRQSSAAILAMSQSQNSSLGGHPYHAHKSAGGQLSQQEAQLHSSQFQLSQKLAQNGGLGVSLTPASNNSSNTYYNEKQYHLGVTSEISLKNLLSSAAATANSAIVQVPPPPPTSSSASTILSSTSVAPTILKKPRRVMKTMSADSPRPSPAQSPSSFCLSSEDSPRSSPKFRINSNVVSVGQIIPKRADLTCSNCNTKVTTIWRRYPSGEMVCNACGLYYRLHCRPRPVSMRRDNIHPRKRRPKNAKRIYNEMDNGDNKSNSSGDESSSISLHSLIAASFNSPFAANSSNHYAINLSPMEEVPLNLAAGAEVAR